MTSNSQSDASGTSNRRSDSASENGDFIYAYSAGRKIKENGEILQSLCLTHSTGSRPNIVLSQLALSDHIRGPKDLYSSNYLIGAKSWEPDEGMVVVQVSAWRYPFLVVEKDGLKYAFWSVTIRKELPVIALAVI